MTPFDRVPDRHPLPPRSGLTLEDELPATGAGARPEVTTTKDRFRTVLADRVGQVARDGQLAPTVGLVPTMGALHGGHAALVRQARVENDLVVGSVFVNPLQFGDPADLEHYPRTLDADLGLLGAEGCDLVFAPAVEEMYPGYPDGSIIRVTAGRMGQVLEGASRPGHFDGVCTVVVKLWNLLLQADGSAPAAGWTLRSYFGQKDAQQLAILRRTAHDLDIPVDVRPVPVVRSPEGLALSSRNTRLSPEALQAALVLFRALQSLRDAAESGRPADVPAARGLIDAEPLAELDYLEVVDHGTLEPLTPEQLARPLDREALALVAATFKPVRLIDNMILRAPSRA